MSLYRMELYKLLHRKICVIAGLIGIGWLMFYFFAFHLQGEAGSIDYGKGWQVFMDIWQLAILTCCVWIILIAAPVFAEESQLRTKSLLFTTERGTRKDIEAKIAAVVCAAIFAYLSVFLFVAGIVGSTFGFSGGEAAAGTVLGYTKAGSSLQSASIGFAALLYLFHGMAAVLGAGAITLFASGLCKNTFYAVVVAFGIYVIPVFIGNLKGIFFKLAIMQPAIASVWFALFEISKDYGTYLALIVVEIILLTAGGYWRYAAKTR